MFDCFFAELVSHAGLFGAAKRQRQIEHTVGIDPHRPGLEFADKPVCDIKALRPNARAESILRVIGACDHLTTSVNRVAVSTGPKISSWTTRICGDTLVRTVGCTYEPGPGKDSPPTSTSAPCARPDSI